MRTPAPQSAASHAQESHRPAQEQQNRRRLRNSGRITNLSTANAGAAAELNVNCTILNGSVL